MSFYLLAVALAAAGCLHRVHVDEISRDRAIEIARSQVRFQPDSTDTVKAKSGSRAIWRVTFRGRLPGQPPPLFETVTVEIDRVSGEVVSVARN